MQKKRHNSKDTQAPNVSPLYDDALPTSLRHRGVSEQSDKAINLHRGDAGELSPYIIHLSHDEPVVTREAVSPRLDALAQQLVIDEPSHEEAGEAESLLVQFDDLVDQLREPDLQTGTAVSVEQAPARAQEQPTAPVEATDLLQASEVRAELIDQEVAKEHLAVVEADVEEEIQEETFVYEETGDEATFFDRLRLSFRMPTFFGARGRALAAFTAMSIALVLPLHAIQQVNASRGTQAEITDAGRAAIDSFLRGTEALGGDRFDVASVDFARASQNFSEAEDSLNDLNAAVGVLVSVIPQTDRTYDSVTGLVTAGKELSEAAATLAAAAEDLQGREALTVTTKINLLTSYVESVRPHVETASAALDRVDADVIPAEYQETVVSMQSRVPELTESIDEFIQFSETFTTIMGAERKMRYLVVFQNNTELRPTGGFPGSFAELDVLNGEIVNINIPGGGTYDVQGQLSSFVESPEPLSLINPRWEFHDANYFPDFPTSAKKMLRFYEQAGGPTVDGLIAINATMMPKLLEITGPIDMPEYGRTIDSENFLFETQKIVEFEYENYKDPNSDREEDAPKQFIGDLAPIILEQLKEADMPTTLTMMDLLGEGLTEKDVLLYFENNALQSNIESLGWSGDLKQTEGDYLMAVNTNLGGKKTDSVIRQTIDVYSDVQVDGTIINTVTITKEHRGLVNTLFEGDNNVDYFRLYVPKGSELIAASGFEIPPAELFEEYEVPLAQDEDLALIVSNQRVHEASQTDIWEENGKTVFGNWIQTKPGETETIEFTYQLPFKLASYKSEVTLFEVAKQRLGFKDLETHTMLIQKQPGVLDRTTNITINYPDHKNVVWSSHQGADASTDIEVTNNYDHFVRFLLENELN